MSLGHGIAATTQALQQARMLYTEGRWSEAEPMCRSVLEREPGDLGALSLLGIILAQTRRPQEAAELLGRVVAALPDSADAHTNHGNVLRALNRHHEALACYERSLALKPDSAEAHYNRALALNDLGQHDRALESYQRALALKPDHAAAWNNRGGLLHKLARHEEALASIDRAIALQPRLAAAHSNRGITLHLLGRLEEALASYDHALALRPNDAEAHARRGDTLRELEQFDEAVASYDRALALQPNHAEAHADRGATLTAIGRYAEALASYDRALAIDSQCLNAHVNRGVTLHDLKRFHDALASLDEAIRLGRRDAHTHHCRGGVLQELKAFEAAIASYQQALAIDPRTRFLRGNCRHARMQVCDWESFESEKAAIVAALERGEASTTPFVLLSLLDSPALQRRAAEIYVREKFSRSPLPSAPRHPRHDRIRIGYFSADLRNHAVAMLAAGLFESHDRARFELTAFSLGPDVPDELRTRVGAAFDRFLQVDGRTDRDIATLARQLEIDIAVDLGGYTRDARPGVVALRAAPIQVSYLGYLGTLGGQFMDYLLADTVLVPSEAREHYSEKIAYLPSYQVNDSKRPVAERAFTRAELGLPASGFVFCCFNNSYKITPDTFDSWVRILAAAPGSVLFLLGSSSTAERNLRREAEQRGVATERLIFGRSLPLAEYLARYRAADLFLDTLPYNAGTTASDALWAGLPVLTLPGESFASRMAASLLQAAGLPELIAASRADYERRAIELALDAQRLEALKRKLAVNRGRCALFDTPTFARNLESLYQQMYQRHLSGLPPEHLFSKHSGLPGLSLA
jgi:predicted O-linked N-acetylglucosamine transferase (SPINDLY family)